MKKAFDPSVSQAEARTLTAHHARLVRYGLDLTEVLESLPSTVELLDRQEARQYARLEEEEH